MKYLIKIRPEQPIEGKILEVVDALIEDKLYLVVEVDLSTITQSKVYTQTLITTRAAVPIGYKYLKALYLEEMFIGYIYYKVEC